VRWTPVEQIHVTVRFLGEITLELRDRAIERLTTIHVKPFPLPVEGVGVFPTKGVPRVLWVGVGSGHPRLHQLRQQIDDTLLSTGVPFDVRTFHPHLTVGRCSETAQATVAAWARTHRDFAGPVFTVDAFDLYSSERYPGGAHHQRVHTFPLET